MFGLHDDARHHPVSNPIELFSKPLLCRAPTTLKNPNFRITEHKI